MIKMPSMRWNCQRNNYLAGVYTCKSQSHVLNFLAHWILDQCVRSLSIEASFDEGI
jgi:hypothetical protein